MRFANPIRLLLSTALLLSVGATAHAQGYKKQQRPATSYGHSSVRPYQQKKQPEQQRGGQPQQRPPQQPANQNQNRPQFQPQPQPQRSFQPQPGMGNQPRGGAVVGPAPIERRGEAGTPNSAGASSGHGEHLTEWMNNHHNLSPAQQHQALENEPGFHDLPQATQQRMHDRLSQLNAMPEAQRNRIIQRNEDLEKLSPQQREQVRVATQNFATLPPDQRGAALNSGRYTYGFNDQQRSALNGLMNVEPIYPHD